MIIFRHNYGLGKYRRGRLVTMRLQSGARMEVAMRQKIIGGCVIAVLALGGIGVAQATDSVDWSALPADEAALTQLNTQQERALRRAVRHCNDLHRSNHQANACVFTDVDRTMRQSSDAALRAYHFALPRSMRYSEKRNTGLAVKQVLEKRQSAVN